MCKTLKPYVLLTLIIVKNRVLTNANNRSHGIYVIIRNMLYFRSRTFVTHLKFVSENVTVPVFFGIVRKKIDEISGSSRSLSARAQMQFFADCI